LRLKLFKVQSRAWCFSSPQYKYKSSLCRRSFSFWDSFLNLEESICIGSSIDALVGTYFYGVIASVLYGPCIERHSCQCSINQLSHCTAYVMTSVNINGSSKFRRKSLTSYCNPHQNTLIRALSSQSMSHANWRKSTV
jgi:hypothetical protein